MPEYYETLSGVQYEELNDFPTSSVQADDQTVATKWKLRWDDLTRFYEDCFPNPTFGSTALYSTPMRYPGSSWLYLRSVNVAPLGETPAQFDAVLGHNKYDFAIASLVFGTVTWERDSDGDDPGGDSTMKTIDVSVGGEFINLATHDMFWETPADSTKVTEEDVDMGKLIPTIEYSLTMHNYGYLPLDTIVGLLGKTNSADGQVFGHEKKETLLYLGASINRTVTWKGIGTFQITHRFSERRVKWKTDDRTNYYGWNHFWRPYSKATEAVGDTPARPERPNGWFKVVDKDDQVLFPTDDLSELLKATT